MTTDAQVVQVPLWRIRLRLLAKSLRSSWAMFAENPIGLLGLGVILFCGLFALAHPILIDTNKVTLGLVDKSIWDPTIYHPVSGFDMEIS
ncbi:MAG: hypothetical protein PVH17_09620, partial [Anaerolineae bacterium]